MESGAHRIIIKKKQVEAREIIRGKAYEENFIKIYSDHWNLYFYVSGDRERLWKKTDRNDQTEKEITD